MTEPTPTNASPFVDWIGAATLIARMLVWLGIALAVLGFVRTGLVVWDTKRGTETLANIEGAKPRLGGGAVVTLSWPGTTGTQLHAPNVDISRAVARKLNLGRALSRTQLRISYRPNSVMRYLVPPVLAVDDIPEHVKSAAAHAVAGFLALSAGSAIMLGLLIFQSNGFSPFRRLSPRASHERVP
jgi:hypothetical protein